MKTLRLGTRGSQLALWQARHVAAEIARLGGPPCALVVIKTSGDRLAHAPLSEAGGKRLFVKELEDALIGGEIDLAVHSAKDLPAVLPDGLMLAAVPPREDPHDAVVLPRSATPTAADPTRLLTALRAGARIGTTSVRRTAQLTRLVPAARFEPIRGNLDTRLWKLDAGEYDALVLAVAGLRRLGFGERVSAVLPVTACVPAPGQGALAIEIRAEDGETRAAVARTADGQAAAAVAAERALVAALGGGCQVPIGALATPLAGELELQALVISLDGSRALRRTARGAPDDPEALGRRVAEGLLADGAGEILKDARRAQLPVEGSP